VGRTRFSIEGKNGFVPALRETAGKKGMRGGKGEPTRSSAVPSQKEKRGCGTIETNAIGTLPPKKKR